MSRYIKTTNWGREVIVDVEKIIYIEKVDEPTPNYMENSTLPCLDILFVGSPKAIRFYYSSELQRDEEMEKLILKDRSE